MKILQINVRGQTPHYCSNNLVTLTTYFNTNMTKPDKDKCIKALKTLGQLSHAWQDYYGHAIAMDSDGYTPGPIEGNPDFVGAGIKPSSWGGWAAPGEHTPFGVITIEPGDRAEDAAARRAASQEFTSMKFNAMFTDRWFPKCACIIIKKELQ